MVAPILATMQATDSAQGKCRAGVAPAAPESGGGPRKSKNAAIMLRVSDSSPPAASCSLRAGRAAYEDRSLPEASMFRPKRLVFRNMQYEACMPRDRQPNELRPKP